MAVLIIICVVVLAGIGIAIWILISDEKNTAVPINFSETQNLTGDDVLNRVGLEETPLPTLEPEPTLQDPQENKKSSSLLDKIKSKIKLPKKKKANQNLPGLETTLHAKAPGKESLVKKLLSKLPFKKPSKEEDIPEATTFLSLKDHLKENPPEQPTEQPQPFQSPPEPSLGTAGLTATPPENTPSIGTPLTPEEEKSIEKDIHQTDNLENLQEKYTNLNKIFEERSQAFEKLEEQLENELKNKKDFNKVKDLIEKELKDTKDNLRDIQADLTSKNSEIENNQKKVDQLEEKATKLEKEVISKEEEIEKLNQQNIELAQNSSKISINDIPTTPVPTDAPQEKPEVSEVKPSEENLTETPSPQPEAPEPIEENLTETKPPQPETPEPIEEKPTETESSQGENIPANKPGPMEDMEVGEEEPKDEPMLVEEEPTKKEPPKDIPPESPNPIKENITPEPQAPDENPQGETTDKNSDTSGFLDLNGSSEENDTNTTNPK